MTPIRPAIRSLAALVTTALLGLSFAATAQPALPTLPAAPALPSAPAPALPAAPSIGGTSSHVDAAKSRQVKRSHAKKVTAKAGHAGSKAAKHLKKAKAEHRKMHKAVKHAVPKPRAKV